MDFVSVPIDEAEGAILGHNISGSGGRRLLRKGKALVAADIEALRALGRKTVYVARLGPEDVAENRAADRLASAVAGPGLRLSKGRTGRVNFYAEALGLLRVRLDALDRWNQLEGVSLSTLPRQSVVALGKMGATLKVIPYALPESTVRAVEEGSAEPGVGPTLWLDPLPARRVGLVLTGSPESEERVISGFRGALGARVTALGSSLEAVDFVAVDDDTGEAALASVLGRQRSAGVELIILAGETAIQDRFDIAPRAIEAAGGRIAAYGAPVDPGNLLLVAYLDGIPILGAPGCSRSPKTNIVDLVLPRLLVGDRLERRDITVLGHGGLLEDVPERPLPRSWLT